MESTKKKVGRPKKEPTFVKGFRVNTDLKLFLEDLENSNRFINEMLTNTPEFKAFMANKHQQEIQSSKTLFNT